MGLLNAIRCGSAVEARAALHLLLHACQHPLNESDGVQPTVLYGRKAWAKGRNEQKLAELPGFTVSACSRTPCMQHACVARGRGECSCAI